MGNWRSGTLRLAGLALVFGSAAATFGAQPASAAAAEPTLKPVASLAVYGFVGAAGRSTVFTIGGALPSDDTLGHATLSYGDGSPVDTSASPPPTVDHVYAKAGAYTVRFTIVDAQGATATTTVVVTVPALTFGPVGNVAGSGVVAADLDGDKRPDIVVWGSDSPAGSGGFITDYLRTASGGYVTHASYPITLKPQSVQLADLTGDGKLDAIVTFSGGTFANPGGSVDVFAGDGKGGFNLTPVTSLSVSAVTQIEFADLNGDGHLDMVVNTETSLVSPPSDPTSHPTVTVYLNSGKGTFPTQGLITGGLSTPTGPINPADLVNAEPARVFSGGPIGMVGVAGTGGGTPASELNNRGFSNSTPNYLVTLKGDGHGNFVLSGYATVGGTFAGIPLLGDFNGDGKLDVAVTETDSFGYTKLLIGNGNGEGGVSAGPVLPTLLSKPVLGDVNGDGRPDIVGTDANGVIGGYLNGAGERFTATSFGISGTASGLVDMNRDRKADLLVGTGAVVTQVGIALHL